MKIIKAKVFVDVQADKKVYSGGYPAWENVGPYDYLLYTNEVLTDENGKTYEWVIACVTDEAHDKMIQDDRCFALTNIEALQFSDTYTPKKRRILDENKVAQVLEKFTKGEAITQADRDNVNPDKRNGIGWTKQAVDIWRDKGIII